MRRMWWLALLLVGGSRDTFLARWQEKPYPETYRKYAKNWEELGDKIAQLEGVDQAVLAVVWMASMEFRRLPKSLKEACQSRWVPVECKYIMNPFLGVPVLQTPRGEAGEFGVKVQNGQVEIWRREPDKKGGLRVRTPWRFKLQDFWVAGASPREPSPKYWWRKDAPLGLVLAYAASGVAEGCMTIYKWWYGRPASSAADLKKVCPYARHLRNGYRGDSVRFLEFHICDDPKRDAECGSQALREFLEQNQSPGDVVLVFTEPESRFGPPLAYAFVEDGRLVRDVIHPVENNPYLEPVQ